MLTRSIEVHGLGAVVAHVQQDTEDPLLKVGQRAVGVDTLADAPTAGSVSAPGITRCRTLFLSSAHGVPGVVERRTWVASTRSAGSGRRSHEVTFYRSEVLGALARSAGRGAVKGPCRPTT